MTEEKQPETTTQDTSDQIDKGYVPQQPPPASPTEESPPPGGGGEGAGDTGAGGQSESGDS